MTIFKIDMPFDIVLQVMKRTNRRAIRSPETLPDGKYKVFFGDATLTIKRYAIANQSECMRVVKIDPPEKSSGDQLMEMRATLVKMLCDKTGLKWSGHYKVSLPKYQFLLYCGNVRVLSPEYDVHKLFSDPPEIEGLANLIIALYQKKQEIQE